MTPELIEASALALGAVACLRLWWTLGRRFVGPFWMGVYLALPAAVLTMEAFSITHPAVDASRWIASIGAWVITAALVRAIPRDLATLDADAAAMASAQRVAVSAALDVDRQRRIAQAEAGLQEARQILDELQGRHQWS